ncbi:MAG: hypothetical protein ASARMPREDX12_001907 [Alectoria sarmentosa]|nr:MAG: hypothetical protein ASARMPREDX12_001907 [Alectoria sarmentosa]CAD6587325.1 MAG: hypothetical protein ASARMPRED_003063 [Alectoria sarmentosa]
MITSTEPQSRASPSDQAAIICKKVRKVSSASRESFTSKCGAIHLPCPSQRRKAQSLRERPFNLDNGIHRELGGGPPHPDTVLYLAYGSNLCARTFQGDRGIRPLSQVNVVVPELVMTFDLAGLPYVEPCFANTKYRHTNPPVSTSEKSHLLPERTPRYHKDRWKKGLVGVVYEVTKEDYAHIIATEGGGASYQDVLVDCHELPANEDIVPEFPTSQPFKAHTLYSPILPPGEPPEKGGRFSRPDPAYAQASVRYLTLITDGADEHALPGEYKDYLHQLRSYTMTTQKQRLGGWIFGMIWLPLISAVFGLNGIFGDEDGKAPAWLVAVTGALFRGMWTSYDGFFFKLFGDGERTIDEDHDGDEEDDEGAVRYGPSSKYGVVDEKGEGRYEEV